MDNELHFEVGRLCIEGARICEEWMQGLSKRLPVIARCLIDLKALEGDLNIYSNRTGCHKLKAKERTACVVQSKVKNTSIVNLEERVDLHLRIWQISSHLI